MGCFFKAFILSLALESRDAKREEHEQIFITRNGFWRRGRRRPKARYSNNVKDIAGRKDIGQL